MAEKVSLAWATQEVLEVLRQVDDEDRMEIFETVRMLYCVFCGCEHPDGRMCQCWNDE